jgi:hypothetical protein
LNVFNHFDIREALLNPSAQPITPHHVPDPGPVLLNVNLYPSGENWYEVMLDSGAAVHIMNVPPPLHALEHENAAVFHGCDGSALHSLGTATYDAILRTGTGHDQEVNLTAHYAPDSVYNLFSTEQFSQDLSESYAVHQDFTRRRVRLVPTGQLEPIELPYVVRNGQQLMNVRLRGSKPYNPGRQSNVARTEDVVQPAPVTVSPAVDFTDLPDLVDDDDTDDEAEDEDVEDKYAGDDEPSLGTYQQNDDDDDAPPPVLAPVSRRIRGSLKAPLSQMHSTFACTNDKTIKKTDKATSAFTLTDHCRDPECATCVAASARAPSRKGTIVSTVDPGKDWALDSLIITPPGIGGQTCANVWVNRNRLIYAHPLRRRSQALSSLERFLVRHHDAQRLTSDNPGEFRSHAFQERLVGARVEHLFTPAYDHRAAGLVERHNAILPNMARAMHLRSGVPVRFWPYSLPYAAELRCLLWCDAIQDIPFRAQYNIEPSYHNVFPFGCVVDVLEQKELRPKSAKFRAKTFRAIFLGFDPDYVHGTAVLCDLDLRFLQPSRDIVKAHVDLFYKDVAGSGDTDSPSELSWVWHDTDPYAADVDTFLETATPVAAADSGVEAAVPSVRDDDSEDEADVAASRPTPISSPLALPTPPRPVSPPRPSAVEDRHVRFTSLPLSQQSEYAEHLIGDPARLVSQAGARADRHARRQDSTGPAINVAQSDVYSSPGPTHLVPSEPATLLVSMLMPVSKWDGHSPRGIKDILHDSHREQWFESMVDEIKRVLTHCRIMLRSDKPTDEPLIPSHLVYKEKRAEAPKYITKRKTRWVLNGSKQRPYLDMVLYAPTVASTSLRTIVHHAAVNGYQLRSLDVVSAFLMSKPYKNVDTYMAFPHSFKQFVHLVDLDLPADVVNNPHKYCLLLLTELYGSAKAPLAFHVLFSQLKSDFGYKVSEHDASFHIKTLADGRTACTGTHVDDTAFSGPDEEWHALLEFLGGHFKLHEVNLAESFTGFQLVREDKSYYLHHGDYIKSIVHAHRLDNIRKYSTPMAPNQLLGESTVILTPARAATVYTDFVTKLGEVAHVQRMSRPEISYATSALARRSHSPDECDLKAVNHLLGYLSGSTEDSFLRFHPLEATDVMFAFTDASLMNVRPTMKSSVGHMIYHGRTLLEYRSSSTTMSESSSYATETIGILRCARQVVFLHDLLTSVGIAVPLPIPILSDNQAAILNILKNKSNKDNNHLRARINEVHQRIAAGLIVLKFIPTEFNLADLLTKSLAVPRFRTLVQHMHDPRPLLEKTQDVLGFHLSSLSFGASMDLALYPLMHVVADTATALPDDFDDLPDLLYDLPLILDDAAFSTQVAGYGRAVLSPVLRRLSDLADCLTRCLPVVRFRSLVSSLAGVSADLPVSDVPADLPVSVVFAGSTVSVVSSSSRTWTDAAVRETAVILAAPLVRSPLPSSDLIVPSSFHTADTRHSTVLRARWILNGNLSLD